MAKADGFSITLVSISVIFGVIALVLACVGIGTPNWQISEVVVNQNSRYIINTANFFYACRFDMNGTFLGCGYRSSNQSIATYFPIDARYNETEWNSKLNNAAGLSIVGIIFIFFGTVATLLMFLTERFRVIPFVGPILLFLACLFMLAGMAEGAFVLFYNGYSANLYQTAHLLTIFSLFISCIAGGRMFSFPDDAYDSHGFNDIIKQ